ncbi:MAG: PocR ligand-binding domain-containing protein [Anaeroplasma sp.]
MHISDVIDLNVLSELMESWSKATGMATIAIDANGKYISERIGFTDFCTKYTRGSKEGLKRCIECDQNKIGTYYCHAGLMDFSIEIKLDNGTYLGKIIGGQILPTKPSEEKFINLAKEFNINEEEYISALHKVEIRSEEAIRASAFLLGRMVNLLVNSEYNKKTIEQYAIELNKKVQRDSLTRLYNTAYCKNKITEMILNKDNFALMMVDLDDFKKVNDNFGHIFGDEVLIKTSNILMAVLPNNYIIGRFGGDEFIVIIPKNNNDNDLDTIASSICKYIDSIRFNTKHDFKLTASIGIAKFPDNALTSKELYEKADLAMYKIKNNGKNDYYIYNDDLYEEKVMKY